MGLSFSLDWLSYRLEQLVKDGTPSPTTYDPTCDRACHASNCANQAGDKRACVRWRQDKGDN
jgi:hypothetical protein